MSLTQQDLAAIKGIVDTSIDHAITTRIKPMIDEAAEDLRLHTAAGFAGHDERMNKMDVRMDGMANDLHYLREKVDHIDGRVGRIEKTLVRNDRRHQVHEAHFSEHDTRLSYLEKHSGLSPA